MLDWNMHISILRLRYNTYRKFAIRHITQQEYGIITQSINCTKDYISAVSPCAGPSNSSMTKTVQTWVGVPFSLFYNALSRINFANPANQNSTYSSPKLFQYPLLRKLELQKETVSPLMTFDVGCAYLKASRRYLLSWKRQNYRRRMMHLFIIHRTFSLLANYKINSNFGQSHEPSQFIRRCLEYQLVHGTLNDDQFSQVHPSFPSGLWSLTFLSSRTLISLVKFHETAAEKLKQTNPY